MELAAKRTKLMQPACPCHLCTKEYNFKPVEFSSEPGYINDPNKWRIPTIFCPYISMWRSQFHACCCVTHSNWEHCQQTRKVKCTCPR